MTRFHDLPIRQKLMALILVTTAAALLIAGAGIVIADTILFQGYLSRDLSTFARVIADNTTASLAFDDAQSAGEILNALRARPHIVAACLLRADGSPLAQYVRTGATYSCSMAAERDEVRFTPESLVINRSVMLRDRRIGTLTIIYDLGEVGERIRLYSLTVLGVIIVASLLVVLLSSKLRTIFVTPILQLASATAQVTERKDYSARAVKLSNDEVGNLVTAFNEMLAGIESRDTDLRKSLAGRDEALSRLAELNRELKRSNNELARSNQDLERFAFIASHDMQEPLRMVTLYAQLLAKEYGDAEGAAATYRDYVVAGAKRMRELIADLLEYMEVTTVPGQPKLVDLNVTLEKVLVNLKIAMDEAGAVVTIEPLPVVRVQEAHVISLFQNLIGNSIKYRGEQPPEIHISVEDVDGMHRFAVTDNGMGIEPEYHSKIFLAFKRLHGSTIPGTGIGLAICQRVVERYGGRIWVESDAGKGATFRFTFPKASPDALGEPPNLLNSLG